MTLSDPSPAEQQAAVEALHRACRNVADNIAEFGTVTDSELLDDLERALARLAGPASPTVAVPGRVVEEMLRRLRTRHRVSVEEKGLRSVELPPTTVRRWIAELMLAQLNSAPFPDLAALAAAEAGQEGAAG